MFKRIKAGHLSVFCLVLGLLCIMIFHFVGPTTDVDGTVSEPFFLGLIAGLAFVCAAVAGVIHFLKSR